MGGVIMAFTKKSLDFLFENHLRDSKSWYQEHKDDYINYIKVPCADFINKIQPVMEQIDPQIICNPKKISRIYRDTRFSKDKSVFRQNVWCIMGRPKCDIELPSFYFEFSPDGIEYGFGCYHTDVRTMEVYRNMIIENDSAFVSALDAYEKQDVFEISGEMYKKNRYPEKTEQLCNWLNRKSVYFCCRNMSFEKFLSDDLAEKVADDFKKVAPIYYFMIKAEETAAMNRIHK